MSTTQHHLAAQRAFYQAIIQVEHLHADSQADLPVTRMLEQVTCLIADILDAPMVWIGLVPHGQSVWSSTAAAGSAAAVFEVVHLCAAWADDHAQRSKEYRQGGVALRRQRPRNAPPDPVLSLRCRNGLSGWGFPEGCPRSSPLLCE